MRILVIENSCTVVLDALVVVRKIYVCTYFGGENSVYV